MRRNSPASHSGNSTGDFGANSISKSLADQKPSLRAHLEAQLALAALPAHRRFIAEVLIDAVDEAGYLRADLAEIADRLGVPIAECESVLAVLQGFDPCGVFARNLAECLALQLKERQRLDPAMEMMLTRLDLVARRDLRGIIRAVRPRHAGHRRDDRGNPRARSQAGTCLRFRSCGDGRSRYPGARQRDGWHIELNPDTLPRVLVNSVYYAEVSRQSARAAREEHSCQNV